MPDNKKGSNSNTANGEVKRKRGRPPKNKDGKENGVKNEGVSKIEMSDKPTREEITIQQVQQRWFNLLNKYNASVGTNNFDVSMRNLNNSLALNPFVQSMRIRNINAQGKKVSKNDIQEYIENPENHEDTLQGITWNLYYQNFVFQSLTNILRDTSMYHYYAICEDLDSGDYSKDTFKKERKKVNEILRKFDPKTTFKDVTTATYIEGKTAYFPRLSYDKDEIYFALLQKLDANRIRLVGFGSETKFKVAMDLSIFLDPAYDVRQYPEAVGEAWERIINMGVVQTDNKGHKYLTPKSNLPNGEFMELINDTWAYWWFIPQGLVETFGTNNAHPYRFSDLLGMIPEVLELDSYKWLQAKAVSRAATSILTGKIPLVADANLKPSMDQTAISADSVLGFSQMFSDNVGDICYGFFSPFEDMSFFDLSEQIPAAMSINSSRLKEVVDASGLSGIISLDNRPSIAAVKTTQLITQERSRYLRNQYEDFLNRFVNNNFDLKYKWTIKLWGENFTFDEDMKLMKELILNGVKGILPRFLSGMGLTLDNYSSAYKEIEAMGIKIIKDETIYQVENNKQMQSEALEANAELQIKTAKIKDTGTVGDKKVGRPSKPNTENDNTAAGQNSGGNTAENRSFSAEELGQYVNSGLVSDLSNEELLEVIQEEILAESENNHGIGEQFKK